MANWHSSPETDNLKKEKFTKENFKKFLWVFKFIKPYRITFGLGFIFLILSSVTAIGFTLIMGKLVDAAQGTIAQTVNELALILLVVLLCQALFSFLRVNLFAQVSEKTMADMRKTLYDKLITLPLPFFEKNRVGDLTSRITADVTQVQDVIGVALAEFIRQIFTLLVGITVIAWFSPQLTLIMLSTFPLLVILIVILGRYIRRLSRKTQDALASSNVIVEETLQGITAVKAFVNEWFEKMRYGKAQNEVVQYGVKSAFYRSIFVACIILAVFGSMLLVLWQGSKMVSDPNSGFVVGDLISFIVLSGFIGGSIGGLGERYTQLQKMIGSSERIREILETPGETQVTEPIEANRYDGKIEFEQVSFNYPSRPELAVLKNITFQVKPGEQVALVGASGAGKSTIAQLLLRFYEAYNGTIKIDGKPLKEEDIQAYRLNVGLVPQDVLLFGGTIRENILYGKPNATEEQIEHAAKMANAWEFIQRFPEKMETLVGERGLRLSGGQKQRVAIARAILKNPAILILDEATSSLDSESEQLVQQALDRLMEGRTSIVIAHRLSTIKNADQILVLKDGEILENGTHEELAFKDKGIYQKLLKLQVEMA